MGWPSSASTSSPKPSRVQTPLIDGHSRARANPQQSDDSGQLVTIRPAAKPLRRDVEVLFACNEAKMNAALDTSPEAEPLQSRSSPIRVDDSQHQITASRSHRLPAIYTHPDFLHSGGLVSYGTDLRDVFRQVGVYATKILQGAAPADLPVTQPRKFELAIT